MSVAETLTARPFTERANPDPQDAGEKASRGGAGRLLRTLLAHHQELGLESAQLAELSRLYWRATPPAMAEAIAFIEHHLSPAQFRKCVGYIVSDAASTDNPATSTPDDVDALVTAALEERLKDKDAVAVDLAAKAADRLISWTKIFGVCVVVPVAAFLALLSFWGVSKVHDLKVLTTRAETIVQTGQQQLDSLGARSSQVEQQIAQLTARQNQDDSRINQLKDDVRSLQEKLKFSVENFLRYFQKLGYAEKTSEVSINTNPPNNGFLSYYDLASGTIGVSKELAEDETLALHEYAHHVLYSSLPFDVSEWIDNALAIEGGLAEYFVASFRDQPVIGAIAAQRLGAAARGALPVNLENDERIAPAKPGATLENSEISRLQKAWGGAFWELRHRLGQNVADKSLYAAWRALTEQDKALIVPHFIAKVAAQLKATAGTPAVEVWRDILVRRGVNNADLPNGG
jgi:hypothetical protein